MTIKTKCKHLILCVFIASSSFHSALVAKERTAPVATAQEANLSFRDIPLLENAFIDTSPEAKDDDIAVGELGKDGGNKGMLLKLAKDIASRNTDKYDSLLIAHKNKLVFESYYLRGRINLPHFQASAAKVYTTLALGRAIQLGYLTMTDLHKPMIGFLKDLDRSKLVDGADKITLHHALTMRSGIRVSREKREAFEKSASELSDDQRKRFKGQGLVQAILESSAPITEETQVFKYQFDPTLVMQVIDAIVPGSAEDFIKKELLDKLGVTNYQWQTAASGIPESGWRSSMTSRDMLKWGLLTINKGQWEGEQLIPPTFINKATSRLLYTGDDEIFGGGKDVSNQGYGYYWWSTDLKVGDKSYVNTGAQGGGGQYITLVEELDLVIVITAHKGQNSTLQTIAERILPAFK